MERAMRLAFVCLCCLVVAPASSAQETGEAEKTRVLLTYGGHGFKKAPFLEMFDAMPDVEYTEAPLPKSAGLLKPGLEKEYDVIVMYDMVGSITAEQREAFVELLETGIGVVSLHHNLGAHRDWDEFRRIVGGKWLFKPQTIDGKEMPKSIYSHGERISVTVADKEHPITKGLEDFTVTDETYGRCYVAPDVHGLLMTDHPKNNPDIAWVTRYGRSPVFYFMLGHGPSSWGDANYREIVARAIRWTAAGAKAERSAAGRAGGPVPRRVESS